MEISDEKRREYTRRIMLARMRLLCNNGFYGLLLMHVGFSLSEEVEKCGCNSETISINPEFLDKISDSELDYVLMHEILHIVLRHTSRVGDFEAEKFNTACDIVVNSNILNSNNMNTKSITLKQFGGEQIHLAPNGKEGNLFTAEELYKLICIIGGKPTKKEQSKDKGMNGNGDADKNDNESEKGKSSEKGNAKGDGKGDGKGNGKGDGKGDGEGNGGNQAKGRNINEQSKPSRNGGWDTHGFKEEKENSDLRDDVWVKRFEDACEAISIRDPSNSRGLMPAFAERIYRELKNPQTDWRSVLNEFVQEEINDYSFSPPDRRFDDSPFFLPDYNEKDETVEKILFMIDTSASMSDDMITAAYSEIKGAIDQFNGKLQGWLGFFDGAVIEPKPFEEEDEFLNIKAAGGGGTDFFVIFEYVAKYMQDEPPVCIIVLTDGYAPFPDEECANNIPVLWLLNNDDINPPWGKVARIKIE